MRSLKSTTKTLTTKKSTSTLKGKRKLSQTKEYPDSPPATPPPAPNVKATATRAKKRIIDLDSPPAKRRRSSDRIANKLGTKRTSTEDDDGFVFTRAPKQKRKAVVAHSEAKEPRTTVAKPFVMDFTSPPLTNPFQPTRQPQRTPPPADVQTGIKDTFVALPISDTPIIRRNQDLRQQATGRRRSSLGLRGNRTSSIGNGFEALPHPDVAYEDFHKHIKVDFPEPVRMKQLLAWCARRALDEQKAKYASTESSNAAAIARAIGEEILRDLIENRISTSWYHRQESSDKVPVTSVKKRPHPQNIENLRKIQQCEERLERLKKEQEAWPQILKSMDDKSRNPPRRIPSDDIDSTLVRPIEASFLRTLEAQYADMAKAEHDVKAITQSGELEFQIDRLYQSLHTVSTFTEVADKYSSRVLEEAEKVLAERERGSEKTAGTDGWDVQMVLRQVTRV